MSNEMAKKLVMSLSILCVGLLVAVGVLFMRQGSSLDDLETAMEDPDVRAEVVDELVAQSVGIFDSFHDPMVGKVMQPNLRDRKAWGARVSTNSLGMREREYAIPKTPGTLRVVLLGDSYIFGNGVEAEQRVGVFLEKALRERAGATATIEVLHIGVPSWNALSECTYVGRQVYRLAPDLVIQVLVPNDLDDVSGVRGFGAQSRFSPQKYWRAGGMVNRRHAASMLAFNTTGFVAHGLDYESRLRYTEAAEHVGRLSQAVQRNGGRYALVMNWMGMQAVAAKYFEAMLAPEQLLWMPFSFFNDPEYRVSSSDGHWNPAGHERVATLFYGAIEERRWLPSLELRSWPEAAKLLHDWTVEAASERGEARSPADLLGPREIQSEIDFADLTIQTSAQIHGGIYRGGGIGPYASFLLARGAGTNLFMEGFCLPETELDGVPVQIFVDEVAFATLRIEPNARFQLDRELPHEVEGREYLSIRLEAADFVYQGDAQESAATVVLARVAIE